jgi:hypothetical protein
VKRIVKRLAPERLRLYVRRAGRLRWVTKARILRSYGLGAWSGKPLRCLRYVLLDPEVDTFTYRLANSGELIRQLAAVLDLPAETLAPYLEEAMSDPELGSALTRDIGWRALFVKRCPPLPSHHLSAWIIIRACKPSLVVETGILEGLGSRAILRALQLNDEEGSPGRLMSFDVLPGAGVLVPDRLRSRWEPIYEPTPQALSAHLQGRRVDLFLHDSVPDPEHLRSELEAVMPYANAGAVLMTVAGWTGVLEKLAEPLDARCETFAERPADHFYSGRKVSWMRLPAAPARGAAPAPAA